MTEVPQNRAKNTTANISQLPNRLTPLPTDLLMVYDENTRTSYKTERSAFTGLPGTSGFSGYSGFSGLNGTASASGYSGYSGMSGGIGQSGFSGYSGSGISGFSGYSGFSGISGYSGYSGVLPDLSSFTTDDLAEGSTNLYYTDARVDTEFDIRLATKTTDDLTEGSTNLYFHDSTAQDAVGNILVATDTITPTYNFGVPEIFFDVNDNSITFTKMQTVSAQRLLGRGDDGSGEIETITIGSGLQFMGNELSSTTPPLSLNDVSFIDYPDQLLDTGIAGDDFNIDSVSVPGTHTFNIPDASDTARGLVTTGDQSFGGVKTFMENPLLPNLPMVDDDRAAVPKDYADLLVAGVTWHAACDAATTGNITLANEQTIDGYSAVDGDRILVRAQTDPIENGIYDVVDGGSWTRSADANSDADVNAGMSASIINGTLYANTIWLQIQKDPVLDTDPLIFSRLATVPAVTASLGVKKVVNDFRADLASDGGLTLDGNSIEINVDNITLEINGSNEIQIKAGVFIPLGGFNLDGYDDNAILFLNGSNDSETSTLFRFTNDTQQMSIGHSDPHTYSARLSVVSGGYAAAVYGETDTNIGIEGYATDEDGLAGYFHTDGGGGPMYIEQTGSVTSENSSTMYVERSMEGTVDITTDFLDFEDNPTNSGTRYYKFLNGVVEGTTRISFNPRANASGDVAYFVDTINTISGSKIFSWRNHGTEFAYLDNNAFNVVGTGQGYKATQSTVTASLIPTALTFSDSSNSRSYQMQFDSTNNRIIMTSQIGTIGSWGLGDLTLNLGSTASISNSRFTITTTSQGWMPPRMTTTQRNAITGTLNEGLELYNITQHLPNYYNGTSWTNPKTKRFVVVTQSATPAINSDTTDIASITGLAQAVTSFTTNLTGTPAAGDLLMVQITDNGTARALTWGAKFTSTTIPLPTTTVVSTLLRVGFQWNALTSVWNCIAVA